MTTNEKPIGVTADPEHPGRYLVTQGTERLGFYQVNGSGPHYTWAERDGKREFLGTFTTEDGALRALTGDES